MLDLFETLDDGNESPDSLTNVKDLRSEFLTTMGCGEETVGC